LQWHKFHKQYELKFTNVIQNRGAIGELFFLLPLYK